MPEIREISRFPLTVNDEAAMAKTVGAMGEHFGAARLTEMDPLSGSADFGLFGTAWGVPSVFWWVGGTDPAKLAAAQSCGEPIPVNHSPSFPPVLTPTPQTGVETLQFAAFAWLD